MKRVVVKKKKVKKIGGVPMDFILMENFFFFFQDAFLIYFLQTVLQEFIHYKTVYISD